MWTKDVLNITKQMRETIRNIEQAARQQESDEVEESAKVLEAQAGSLVAEMQINGIWVGVKVGEGISEGMLALHTTSRIGG